MGRRRPHARQRGCDGERGTGGPCHNHSVRVGWMERTFAAAASAASAHGTALPFTVRAGEAGGRGRSVHASRHLPSGTAVFSSTAAAYVTTRQGHCGRCVFRPAEATCSRCKVVKYCGTACQKADWDTRHKHECRHLPVWLSVLPWDDVVNVRLMNQLAQGCHLSREFGGDGGAAGDGAWHQPWVHTAADVRGLEVDAAQTDHWRTVAEVAEGASTAAGLRSPALRPWAACAAGFGRNNFYAVDEMVNPVAAGVFPAGALLNHSCAPNCTMAYRWVADGDGGGGLVQEVRTARPVQEGEELCHSYVEMARPRWERAAALRTSYGFDCACSMCTAPAEAWYNVDSFLERSLDGVGNLVNGLGGGDKRMPLSEAMAVLRKVGGATPSARRGEAMAVVGWTLCTTAELGHDAATAAGCKSGEVVDGCRSVLTSHAGLEWQVPYVPSVLLAGSPLAPREVGEVRWEVEAMENGVAALRTVCHPHHCDVQVAVANVLSRYMLLNDVIDAIAACLYIIGFYRHVYPHTRHHPMLALQQFTLADLFMGLADTVKALGGGAASKGSSSPWPAINLPTARLRRLVDMYRVEGAGVAEDAVAAAWWSMLPVWSGGAGADPAHTATTLAALAQDTYRACRASLIVCYGHESQLAARAAERLTVAGAASGGGVQFPPCSRVVMKETPTAGRAVFAATAIATGGVVWEEDAVLWVPTRRMHAVSKPTPAALNALATAWQVPDLAAGEVVDVMDAALRVSPLYPARCGNAGSEDELTTTELWGQAATMAGRMATPAASATLFLAAVCNKNGFHVAGVGPTLEPITAVALRTSMFNHSCCANAAHVWSMVPRLDGTLVPRVRIIALRPIHPGQEVTLRYIDCQLPPRHARRRTLRSRYDFTCHCPRCDDGVDDAMQFRCPCASPLVGEVAGGWAPATNGVGGSCDGAGHCDGVVPGYATTCCSCGARVEDAESLVDEREAALTHLLVRHTPPWANVPNATVCHRKGVGGDDEESDATRHRGSDATSAWHHVTALLHPRDAACHALLRQEGVYWFRAWRDAVAPAATGEVDAEAIAAHGDGTSPRDGVAIADASTCIARALAATSAAYQAIGGATAGGDEGGGFMPFLEPPTLVATLLLHADVAAAAGDAATAAAAYAAAARVEGGVCGKLRAAAAGGVPSDSSGVTRFQAHLAALAASPPRDAAALMAALTERVRLRAPAPAPTSEASGGQGAWLPPTPAAGAGPSDGVTLAPGLVAMLKSLHQVAEEEHGAEGVLAPHGTDLAPA